MMDDLIRTTRIKSEEENTHTGGKYVGPNSAELGEKMGYWIL